MNLLSLLISFSNSIQFRNATWSKPVSSLWSSWLPHFVREAHLRKTHTCSEDLWQGPCHSLAMTWSMTCPCGLNIMKVWIPRSLESWNQFTGVWVDGVDGSMGHWKWSKFNILWNSLIKFSILNDHLTSWYPWDLDPRKLDCLCGTERRNDEQLPRVHFAAPDHAKKSRMPSGLHLDAGLFRWWKVSPLL